MIKKIFLLCVYCCCIYAAGWTIVGDTFTADKGTCEFDIWLNASQKSQNLGFYGDCVIFKYTSLQIANNASTQSLENKGFIEIEQGFYTTKDNFFNIGIIGGSIINTDISHRNSNFYAYFPLSFNWLNERLRTTINIGWAYHTGMKQNLLTLGASISGNITKRIWVVSEFSTSNAPHLLLNASFYQIGASFLIHKDNISLDLAYLNSFRSNDLGTLIFGISFNAKLFD
ncbi:MULTISPECIES: hypothetical protein [unclassified Helicobacter]|uniref:hypothetical protein n=1 Tax=unclassified Helicobacter TaxID=2593540 RepID=UPI000CF17082|nr:MULTISPECIES: hypothetical protein [unclassified Helicobacter]